MADRNNDPWADASNQAVGALYKYFLTRPSEADLLAARQKQQLNDANVQKLTLDNQMNQRLYDMGGWSGAPASVQENLYGNSLGAGSDAAKRFEDVYVTKPSWQDFGDKKVMMGVNGPMQGVNVGLPPERKIDLEGQQTVVAPSVPSTPIANLFGQSMPVAGNAGRQVINQYANNAGVNPQLADAAFGAESTYGTDQGPSSAGAIGPMQTLPSTLNDPGFGVAPAQNDTQHEQARVGVDYLAAMVNRYKGDEKLALMAYNWGPGNVDNWLQSGADPNAVPAETQAYVQKVLSTDVSGQMGAPAAPQQPQPAAQAPNLFAPTTGADGVTVTPIPKSPAAQAKVDELNRTKNIVSDVVNDDINGIFKVNSQASLPTTGMIGNALSNVGGTASNDIRVKLGSIKSNIALDNLQQMRQNSPTGGALGNVSDKDASLLTDRFGALEQSQSQEQFLYHLARLQNAYNDVIHGVGNGPERLDPIAASKGYTNEDLDFTADKYGISRQDVINRLRGGQ